MKSTFKLDCTNGNYIITYSNGLSDRIDSTEAKKLMKKVQLGKSYPIEVLIGEKK